MIKAKRRATARKGRKTRRDRVTQAMVDSITPEQFRGMLKMFEEIRQKQRKLGIG
jgi:hypothetical protein